MTWASDSENICECTWPRLSHQRSRKAKRRRFESRWEAGKIDWHGHYVGYQIKTQSSSARVGANSNSSMTSAQVDDKPKGGEISASVEASNNVTGNGASAVVDERTMAQQVVELKRQNDLLLQSNSFFASKGDLLQDQVALLEARVQQISDLRLENLQIFNEKQNLAKELDLYKEQLCRAEEAIGAWVSHALQLESQSVSFQCADPDCAIYQSSSINYDDNRDEARVRALERAFSELHSRIKVQEEVGSELENKATEVSDRLRNISESFSGQIEVFKRDQLTGMEQLVSSLQGAVQRQCSSFQKQLDEFIPRPEGSRAKSPGREQIQSEMQGQVLHSLPLTPTEISAVEECHQLQASNFGEGRQKGGNKSEGGTDEKAVENAECHQLQHSQTASQDPQLTNAQSNLDSGRRECHQLQLSHETRLTSDAASAINHSQYDWLSMQPVLISDFSLYHTRQVAALLGVEKATSNKVDHEADSAARDGTARDIKTTCTSNQCLNKEEQEILNMTNEEFENKMAGDRDLLQAMFGHEVLNATADGASLTIGTRVCTHSLDTMHLNGLSGIISHKHGDRYAVLLEDGSTRKFHSKFLFASSTKPTRGSQSQSISSAASSGLAGEKCGFEISESQQHRD